MTQACTDIEAEIDAMYAEAQAIFHDIEGTIGDLSDLRYGRFNKPAGTGHTTGEQVLQDLQRLEEVCRGRLLR